MAERASDPYQVLLKSNKLPMSLVRDGEGKNGLKQHQAKMQVQSEPFSNTFGVKAQRRRVKLAVGSLEDLAKESSKMHDTYLDRLEQAKLLSGTSGQEEAIGEAVPEDVVTSTAQEPIFSKGQSKRVRVLLSSCVYMLSLWSFGILLAPDFVSKCVLRMMLLTQFSCPDMERIVQGHRFVRCSHPYS